MGKLKQNNFDVRAAMVAAGLTQWEVADGLGIPDYTFSRWMRYELDDEQRDQVLTAIDRLKKQRAGGQA